MQQAINQFRENIGRIRAIHGYYLAFSAQLTSAADISDILRSEVVMVVSALDHYVHEATRLGMIEACSGSRPHTQAFLKFGVSLDSMLQSFGGASGSALLDAEVRARHALLSFQQPDKIADAVRLYSPVELWPRVATELGERVEDLKLRLRLIVERRNKIAHEADLDPSYPGTRWPINPQMVDDCIGFISRLCEAIQRVTV
jgi:hypothetical protein